MRTTAPQQNQKRTQSSQSGFTLIELMVSLTIFSILMSVSVGTLLTLIDVNAKAQALSSSATNLSFALDSITREMRTGHYYYCTSVNDNGNSELPDEDTMHGSTGDCEEGDLDYDNKNAIVFIRDRDNYKVGYRLNASAIEQRIQAPNDGAYETDWEQITSEDIIIDTFALTVSDSETNYQIDEDDGITVIRNHDTGQPVVTLHIKGHLNNGLETQTDFNIQSLIVQRKLDQV